MPQTPEADALSWALALVVASERLERNAVGFMDGEHSQVIESSDLDELRRVRIELDASLKRLIRSRS